MSINSYRRLLIDNDGGLDQDALMIFRNAPSKSKLIVWLHLQVGLAAKYSDNMFFLHSSFIRPFFFSTCLLFINAGIQFGSHKSISKIARKMMKIQQVMPFRGLSLCILGCALLFLFGCPEDSGNNGGGGQGALSGDQAEIEPNDSLAIANEAQIGSITGALDVNNDRFDYFRFSVSGGGDYSFAVRTSDSTDLINLRLKDTADTSVILTEGGVGDVLMQHLDKDMEIMVRVRADFIGADNPNGRYVIDIRQLTEDEVPDDGGDGVEPLDFFEQELAKKWSRLHGYDNSRRYYVFKGDRSACYFEYSSSGSRSNNKTYTHWELAGQAGGNNVFTIRLTTPSGGIVAIDEFHYNEDEIWKGGYDNLRMRPSTTSRDCQ